MKARGILWDRTEQGRTAFFKLKNRRIVVHHLSHDDSYQFEFTRLERGKILNERIRLSSEAIRVVETMLHALNEVPADRCVIFDQNPNKKP